MCSESTNSAKATALSRRALPSEDTSYRPRPKALSRNIHLNYVNVNGSIKVIVHRHPDADQRQHLTTSRGSPLVHAYHVWSTSANAFMSYPAQRQTNRTNERQTDRQTVTIA